MSRFDTLQAGALNVGGEPLPDDNYVLATYKNIFEQTGSNALRAVRKLYQK